MLIRIGSFDNLKNGDLIISPIDNEVTEFRVNQDGDKFLVGADNKSLFPIFQFNPDDFYFYHGEKKNGEKDYDYFNSLVIEEEKMHIKGVCRTFTNTSVLRKWLEEKNYECGSPEAFSEWLERYFEEGNEIIVHGESYSLLDCVELV